MPFAPLLTQRLILRPFQRDDWRAIHAFLSDPDVTTYLPEGRFDAAQTRAFVAQNCGEEASALAVVPRGEAAVVGYMLFHPWFAHRTYEVGWVFHPAAHGQGYATEAGRALLRYGFTTLQLHRIIATCQPENPASYRVMEKLGMRREGHFRQCIYRGDDRWWDEYLYALLADEWRAAQRSVARP